MNCHCCHQSYTSLSESTYKCIECGHIFRDYQGDNIQYHSTQYRNLQRRDINEIDKEGMIKQLFHRKRRKICQQRMRRINPYLISLDKCLDVGSGGGTFANLLRKKVLNVDCLELSPTLINELKRLKFFVYESDYLSINFKKTYNMISAWHVLEHIVDIKKFVDISYSITNRFLIIEVPLLESLNGKGRKRKLEDPNKTIFDGHYHYFSEKSFRNLMSGSFNIIELQEGIQSPSLFAVMEKIQ